ncbi:MAG: GTP-binding protein HSR1 [Deltaproteobacteria bacterium]|nr:MAG: GTP-binding protein HSR1 [Deltaproteobacteria bacterium]
MPANLPPEYFAAEKRFREAKTPAEKVAALETMLAIMPHHKGTDKLRALLRRKLAKLREEQESRRGKGARGDLYSVRKEGAGQVAMAGPPNVGKSQLLASLTKANPEIGDYPFTTQRPQAGMIPFENVKIQLVDLPPVTEHTDPWVFSVLRNADLLLLVVDISADPLGELDLTKDLLLKQRIVLVGEGGPDGHLQPGTFPKRAIVAVNKGDLDPGGEDFEAFRELCHEGLPMIEVSAKGGHNLEELKRKIFFMLEIIRVYPKPPGKEPDRDNPVVLKKGSTVEELAEEIHKDFVEKLRYARIWGSAKFDGQRVHKDYVLQDGDVVELHL